MQRTGGNKGRSGEKPGMGVARVGLALAAVIVLGAVSGCGKKGDSAQSESAPDTVQSEQPVVYDRSSAIVDTTRPVSDSVVLAAVFGPRGVFPVICDSASHPDDDYGYDRPKMWHVHWKPGDGDYTLLGFDAGEADSVQYACVAACREFELSGTQYAGVLVESVAPQFGCHACSPSAMAVTFVRGDSGWTLLPGTNYAPSAGSYGHMNGELNLVRTGPETMAWTIESTDGNQGYMYTYLQVVALPPATQEKVTSIELGGSNGGACGPEDGLGQCWEYSGEYRFDSTAVDNGYYVLRVEVSGTADVDGAVRDASRTPSYRWENGAWSLID